MTKQVAVVAALVLFAVSGGQAFAALNGPVFPPPGGVSYAFSGSFESMGHAGGLDITYSGLDMSKFSDLYWGPWDATCIKASLDGTSYGSGETLAFDSIVDSHTARWTGSSSFTWVNSGGPWQTQVLDTRFTLTTPTMGMVADPRGSGAVAQITGDYTANLLFEAKWGSDWLPILDLEKRVYSTPYPTAMEYSGGFLYEDAPPATPELPSAGLLLVGMVPVGLAWLRRRRG